MITHDLRDVCVHEPVGVCRTEHMYGSPSGGHADLIRKEYPLCHYCTLVEALGIYKLFLSRYRFPHVGRGQLALRGTPAVPHARVEILIT
jgi:hypothetical protein